jgi:hypothetical protein
MNCSSWLNHPWRLPIRASSTQNLKLRTGYILRKVETGGEPMLFWAACRMREIVAEGRLRPEVAVKLLESAYRLPCRMTIAAAFLTVERKLEAQLAQDLDDGHSMLAQQYRELGYG